MTPVPFVGSRESTIARQGKAARCQRQYCRGEERSAIHNSDPIRLAALPAARDEPATMTAPSRSESLRSGFLPEELLLPSNRGQNRHSYADLARNMRRLVTMPLQPIVAPRWQPFPSGASGSSP